MIYENYVRPIFASYRMLHAWKIGTLLGSEGDLCIAPSGLTVTIHTQSPTRRRHSSLPNSLEDYTA